MWLINQKGSPCARDFAGMIRVGYIGVLNLLETLF